MGLNRTWNSRGSSHPLPSLSMPLSTSKTFACVLGGSSWRTRRSIGAPRAAAAASQGFGGVISLVAGEEGSVSFAAWRSAVENIRQICQNLAKYPSNFPQFQSKFRTCRGGELLQFLELPRVLSLQRSHRLLRNRQLPSQARVRQRTQSERIQVTRLLHTS